MTNMYFKLLQATGKPVRQIIIEKKIVSKVLFTILEFWKHNHLKSHNISIKLHRNTSKIQQF